MGWGSAAVGPAPLLSAQEGVASLWRKGLQVPSRHSEGLAETQSCRGVLGERVGSSGDPRQFGEGWETLQPPNGAMAIAEGRAGVNLEVPPALEFTCPSPLGD